MGWNRSKADPDLWYRPEVPPEDGTKYYVYVLFYINDTLVIHHDATLVLLQLDKYFQMKKGSIGDPDIYLGAKLRTVRLDNGVTAWAMSSSKYVQEAIRNVELYLDKNFAGRKLQRKVSAPWPSGFSAETDDSPVLDAKLANYYQSQVGVLQWILELGRVDVIVEVSTLASQMAMPREAHLDALFHVYAYLKARHNARMVFDPTYPELKGTFQTHDWTD